MITTKALTGSHFVDRIGRRNSATPPHKMAKIKTIITDFDGVIRHWQNRNVSQLEVNCRLPKGSLFKMCFSDDLLMPAITGKITYQQWVEQVRKRILDRYGLSISEHFVEAWQSEQYRIDHGLLADYERFFPRASLALATNATSRLPEELAQAGLKFRFGHVFNSSAMGVAKPSKQFFSAMMIFLGVQPAETVFIDDSEANVAAARLSGLNAVHYRTRTQVLADLEALASPELASELQA